MCGIVGMTFREEGWQPSYDIRKVRNIFTEMLLNAQERGSSAAGVVMTSWSKSNRKPNVVVLKAPLAAEEFVETEAYKSLMARLSKDTLSIIGHTRASTSGSATDNHNNHPHVCGSIIGVHNGHINSDEKIWLRYGETLSRKSSCDSEAMFSLLNHRLSTEDGDMSKAFQATVPELEGWYALAMINLKEPGKTYLFRDKKSPLELSWWVRNETVLFASTSTWFERALRKH
jgi:glucosamine 6-phosphate synthetase-like amidotransferase/phosphosugar isomerase protein